MADAGDICQHIERTDRCAAREQSASLATSSANLPPIFRHRSAIGFVAVGNPDFRAGLGKIVAIAAPMPDAPPVTSAVLYFRSNTVNPFSVGLKKFFQTGFRFVGREWLSARRASFHNSSRAATPASRRRTASGQNQNNPAPGQRRLQIWRAAMHRFASVTRPEILHATFGSAASSRRCCRHGSSCRSRMAGLPQWSRTKKTSGHPADQFRHRRQLRMHDQRSKVKSNLPAVNASDEIWVQTKIRRPLRPANFGERL